MNKRTPIVIFTYNRPKHTRQLLESLLKCSRLDECAVYIFCDGAKSPEHQQSMRASREVVHEFAPRLNAKVIEREQNVGLARSIVSGVTELCGQCGRVIVLEDDFILHPFFLDFMLQSLDRYADDESVAQVAGFIHPIRSYPKFDAFFLPVTSSWGWATWQRSWNLFSWDTQLALTMLDADPQLSTRFDLHDTRSYTDMLRLAHESKLSTWDIQWYWQIFFANKLVLYPHQSLIWQNGFDEVATNTKAAWRGLQAPFNKFVQTRWEGPISFPNVIQTDQIAFQSLKSFYRRTLSRRIISRLKRMVKYVFPSLVK